MKNSGSLKYHLLCRRNKKPRGRPLRNQRGNFLVGILVLMGAFSVMSLTAVRFLSQEHKAIEQDYTRLLASAAARSCIEIGLAKLESSYKKRIPKGQVLKWSFGAKYFPQVKGNSIQCLIKARPVSQAIQLESRGLVKSAGSAPGPGGILAEYKIKASFKTRGGNFYSLWQVEG